MPDLRMPDVSGRTLTATVAVMVGVVVILVAVLSGSSSPNSDDPAQSRERGSIQPVAPIDPEDAQDPDTDTSKALEQTNPFASSFGEKGKRKVTVTVTGNGAVGLGLSYRDGKQSGKRVINGSFSKTRTFSGRFPMASAIIQVAEGVLPGSATRATCTITIDGVEVARKTTTMQGSTYAFCLG